MKYSFKKYILLSVPVFRQQVHIRAKKRHSLSESVLSPAVNYFRACLSIQMFLLKLAM
jgi:hypothetical protein